MYAVVTTYAWLSRPEYLFIEKHAFIHVHIYTCVHSQCTAAVGDGTVAGCVFDLPILQEYANDNDCCQVVGSTLSTEYYGIAAPPRSPIFEFINKELITLQVPTYLPAPCILHARVCMHWKTEFYFDYRKTAFLRAKVFF